MVEAVLQFCRLDLTFYCTALACTAPFLLWWPVCCWSLFLHTLWRTGVCAGDGIASKKGIRILHHIKSILFLLSPSLKSVLILFASPMANSWLFRSLAKCKADRRPIVCCSDRQVCNYVISFLSTTFKHLHGKWQTIAWINIVHEKKKMPNK